MENPFSLAFGRAPISLIERDEELQPIIADFNSVSPRSTVYILTGPRGCGKTVAFSRLLDHYRAEKDWVVARIGLGEHMLEQLASSLYEFGMTKFQFLKTEFSFSFHGFTFSVRGDNPVSSIQAYLNKLLGYFDRKGIKVLVGIDDIVKTEQTAEFVRAYQGFLVDHHEVRLLMTGLYKNVSKLESDKSLTFLYRSPKIMLKPLSLMGIATSYRRVFSIDQKTAVEMAKLTMGYAFGYQILGDIAFREKTCTFDQARLEEYDVKLSDWSYSIIWNELSEREKAILSWMAKGMNTNEQLMNRLKVSKGNLAIYRKKLSVEGIVDTSRRGIWAFSLPRFGNFVAFQNALMGDER